MSTRIWESSVIDAPIATVWELVRPLNFSYSPAVVTAALDGKEQGNEVGSSRTVTYKDKTVQKLRLTELSDAKHAISWDLVSSEPAHHVMSASYSVRLRPITQGGQTFIEWVVDFSKDVTHEATADAVYKAREHFKQIAATAKSKLLDAAAKAQFGKNKVSVPQLQRQLSAKSEQLHKLFTSLDKNKNGVLEFDEFAIAVNKLYGENLADEAIRMLLRAADTNNDQVVSYDEFVKFLATEGLESKAQSVGDVKAPPQIAMHYFNARGRLEVARLILKDASIPFTDNRHDFAHFKDNLKAKAAFGQMPYMELGAQKTHIAQSQAINRYVAKLAGVYGKSLEDMARIDMFCEQVEDIVRGWSAAWYEKDAKAKEEKVAKFLAEQLNAMLTPIEKQLAAAKKGTNWLVGNAFSLADVMLYDICSKFVAKKPDILNATPLVSQLMTRVATRPNIAAWIKARPASEN